MKKYKITKFTEEEKQDIKERYIEWFKPENIVWVEKEYNEAWTSLSGLFGSKGSIDIHEKVNSFSFLKSYAEKIWVLEKLKDHQMHSSPYINNKIGQYPIKDFNDETRQRITLEEMEAGGLDGSGFLSDFIDSRIKEMSFESFQEEMRIRQKLSDCEMHTTPYVESRIWDFEMEDLDDEIFQRIK